MARDILKAKFACSGYDLRDDNTLYLGEKLIAENVRVTDDEPDCIMFDFDLVVEDQSSIEALCALGMPIRPKNKTLH
jgi:hypothetical protein